VQSFSLAFVGIRREGKGMKNEGNKKLLTVLNELLADELTS
jgi:hypothetical protein